MAILIAGLQFQPYFQATDRTSSCGPNSLDKLVSSVEKIFRGRLDSTGESIKVVVSGFSRDEKVRFINLLHYCIDPKILQSVAFAHPGNTRIFLLQETKNLGQY